MLPESKHRELTPVRRRERRQQRACAAEVTCKIFRNPLTFCATNSIIVAQKVGGELSPRTGRPKAEKPKTVEVKARIDEETNIRLEKYCEKHGVTRTDVVREGIETVLRQKK